MANCTVHNATDSIWFSKVTQHEFLANLYMTAQRNNEKECVVWATAPEARTHTERYWIAVILPNGQIAYNYAHPNFLICTPIHMKAEEVKILRDRLKHWVDVYIALDEAICEQFVIKGSNV
jgi:hypothetical protein